VKIVSTRGAILDGGDTGGNDIIANAAGAAGVTLEAATGIGNAIPAGSLAADAAIDMAAYRISGDTDSGDINIDNTSVAGQPVTVSSLSTGSGNITFDQTGGADITFVSVITGNGSDALTNSDAASNPNITVGNIIATDAVTVAADGSIFNDGVLGTLVAATGTIGVLDMPVEVDIDGTLYVQAGGMENGWLSVNLQGRIVDNLNVAPGVPGMIMYNNTKFGMPSPFGMGSIYYYNNEITSRWFKAIAQNDEGMGTDLNRYKLYLDVYGDAIFAPYADMISIEDPGVKNEIDEKELMAAEGAKM
jgi:hypothetical protein